MNAWCSIQVSTWLSPCWKRANLFGASVFVADFLATPPQLLWESVHAPELSAIVSIQLLAHTAIQTLNADFMVSISSTRLHFSWWTVSTATPVLDRDHTWVLCLAIFLFSWLVDNHGKGGLFLLHVQFGNAFNFSERRVSLLTAKCFLARSLSRKTLTLGGTTGECSLGPFSRMFLRMQKVF